MYTPPNWPAPSSNGESTAPFARQFDLIQRNMSGAHGEDGKDRRSE
jgi:hypothetical protein